MKYKIIVTALLVLCVGALVYILTKPPKVEIRERIVYINKTVKSNTKAIGRIEVTNNLLVERKHEIEKELFSVLTGGAVGGFIDYTNTINIIDRNKDRTIGLLQENCSLLEEKCGLIEKDMDRLVMSLRSYKILSVVCGAVAIGAAGWAVAKSF
jgi:hypothetical protein